MTPIILNRLGSSEYGLWVFLSIFSVSGYFSLLDLGFQGAAIKYVAEFLATNQRQRLASVINASIVFFTLAGLAGAFILWGFNIWFLPSVFHIPVEHLALTQALITILALGFIVQFPAFAFSAILEGLQRYDLLRGVNIVVTILTNIVLIIWATGTNGLPFLVWSLVISGGIMTLIYGVMVRRLLPDIAWKPWHFEREPWQLLSRLSIKLFASKIVGLIFNNTDKILIGIFLTVQDQTNYDIVNKLHIILLSLLSIINQAVLPASSELSAQNNTAYLQTLVIRATKYSAAMVIPLLLFLIVLPKLAIGMWVGPDYAYLSPLVTLYCLHIFLTMLVGVSSTMFVGMNRVGQVLSISIWAAVINIVISTVTVQHLGIKGLILGTTIAYLISSAIYIRATGRIFKIGVSTFLRQTIRPIALAACGSLIVILTFKIFSHGTSIWLGLSVIGLSYLIFGAIFIRWGISKEELLPILSAISRRKTTPTV